jgi:hypothetical protein
MYRKLESKEEYKDAWLKSEIEFAILCFTTPGCFQKDAIAEDINLINEIKESDLKDILPKN